MSRLLASPFRITLALAFVPAAIAYPIFRWVYGPVHDWAALGFLRKLLPKSELFYHWGRSRFRWIWATVYDFSNAPIAHYLKRPELEQWAKEWGLKELNITWRHRSTWRFQAIK